MSFKRSRLRSRRSRVVIVASVLGVPLIARIARRLIGAIERRRLFRLGISKDVRWKWMSHQLVAVQVEPELKPHDAYVQMRDACTAVLENHGVPYAVTSTSQWQRHTLAIPDTHWELAVRALAEAFRSTPTYFSLRARLLAIRWVSDTFHVSQRSAVAHAVTQAQVLICTMRARGSGSPVFGPGFGLLLQRWKADESWVAPAANQTATRVDPSAFETTELLQEHGSLVRRFAGSSSVPFTQPQFPIDVVYLWVDGSDPAWLAERSDVLGEPREEGAGGQGEWLFRDRDELLYSLRSLEENAPWVRKIHLFTANQVPRWLNLSHPKLEVHFHRDVFADPQALPTYNSHAIGSQVHRIPGLAEHYIVMNDDVFFGRPVEPSQFFTPGGLVRFRYSKHHVANEHDPSLSAIEQARHHTASVIEQIHGTKPSAMFAHAPVPQRRSEQEYLEGLVSEEFKRTMYSRTRSGSDLVPLSWLHLNHLYLAGKATEASYRYGYYFLANSGGRAALARAMRSRRPHVYCLNDGPDVEGYDYAEWLVSLLEDSYPVPSAFELPPGKWRDVVHVDSIPRGAGA